MDRKIGMNKRLYVLAIIILLCFSSLVVRLFWIGFVKGDEYSKEAANQRNVEIRLSMPRGMIYDRNFIPLVNREKQLTLFVFKDLLVNHETLFNQVKKHFEYSEEKWDSLLNSNKNIIEIPIEEDNTILQDNIKNILIADKVIRYDSRNILSHVIGYVNSSSYQGVMGVEDGYNIFLSEVDEKKGVVAFTIDGRKQLIPGLGVTQVIKESGETANGIQLTIDYHIQKVIEEAIGDTNGAVVVAEVKSGDIVAMASRPNFDQNNVSKHFDSEDKDFYNKAMQLSYNPGSIFKIVVLLSALENNVVDVNEKFTCSGSEEVHGVTYQCNKEEGHGEITLEEGLAYSCNSVFIQLGERVGSEKIIDTAKKLGLGQEVVIGGLDEDAGRLPEGDDLLGAAIGNISIGQDKIEVTPLQVTNMMMTIANNGVQKDMTIYKRLVSESGVPLTPYNRNEDVRIISIYHSLIVKDYLKSALDYGTGSHLDLEEVGGAAGKTGSAQAGKENEIIHGWFSGYFPKKNPRYVITVLVEEGGAGGTSAGPIFEDIAKGIVELGK